MTTSRLINFGRLEAPDPRDRAHPMRAVLPKGAAKMAAQVESKLWHLPARHVPLNQGNTGTCVGHGWKAFLLAGPMSTKTGPSAREIYRRCVTVDEWTQNDWEASAPDSALQFGTSVRAGAKVLQALGHISEYVWAFDEPTMRQHVLLRGPVVIGIDWHEGMYETDETGFLQVTGDILGGHCVLVHGYSKDRKAYRGLNSWSASFGQNGRFWLRSVDMAALLERGGEAASAIEQRAQL